MNFSERFKALRERKGLSQEALAEKLNIPRSTVTNYENNEDRIPRQQRLNEIADFFGVSVDYLIGRADTTELTKAEENFISDINKLTLEEIIAKHAPDVDGRPATYDEVKAAIAFIQSMRKLK